MQSINFSLWGNLISYKQDGEGRKERERGYLIVVKCWIWKANSSDSSNSYMQHVIYTKLSYRPMCPHGADRLQVVINSGTWLMHFSSVFNVQDPQARKRDEIIWNKYC